MAELSSHAPHRPHRLSHSSSLAGRNRRADAGWIASERHYSDVSTRRKSVDCGGRHASPSVLKQPSVSVLIRVRNEAAALRRLLACLHRQKLARPFEIVVIDNESDDASAEVARQMDARVFTFPRSLFGYGRSINAGMKLCSAELVVLLSAHAWPQGEEWLAQMVDCIESRAVAAAYCRQIPDRDATRQERARFKVFSERDWELDRRELVRRCTLGEDVYEACAFSNSAAIVRREVVRRLPFRDLPFAEDRAFALDCVMAGHAIAYLGTACVAYRQPVSPRNFYRIGLSCNIAKHLIRELGGEALGLDLRKPELARKMMRLLFTPLEIAGRAAEAALRERSQVWRAARYAAMRGAMALGSVVGELTWQRHQAATRCDASALLMAERSVTMLVAETTT
jgi:rhamnosyltransferase